MAQSVNMTDTEIFQMWLILHEKRLRKLRNKFEKETSCQLTFNEFAYSLYMDGQDMVWLNYN